MIFICGVLLLLMGIGVQSQLSQIVDGVTNPCLTTYCPASTRCVVRQDQYFTAPYNRMSMAVCEKIGSTGIGAPTMSGIGGGSSLMEGGSKLIYGGTTGRHSCSSITCGAGQQCILQHGQCVRSPCYPVPQCVKTMGNSNRVGRKRRAQAQFDAT